MEIVTEEMRYRQRLCEYALKHGVSKAARRFHTYRQFVYRQLARYKGTAKSLALKSRKPKHSPTAHNKEELQLIRRMLRRNGSYGLAAVYARCRHKGYTRSFSSMCRQIRKRGYQRPSRKKKSYTRYRQETVTHPGEKVQIDIKYVPKECILFPNYGEQYYQITAIDEYSRKRVLKIVKERSTYETAIFLRDLEKEMGFIIQCIQVDSGYEFVNDRDRTDKETLFSKMARQLGMEIKRIRPYSPWQNRKVERSHREDGKILYKRRLTSEKERLRQVKTHQRRYNSTAKYVLDFQSPDEVVASYFSKV